MPLFRCSSHLAFAGLAILLVAIQAVSEKGHAAEVTTIETANFRILSFPHQAAGQTVAVKCEAIRGEVALRWLGREAANTWTPKCDIVLHATDDAYLREVGRGGRNTVASSLIDRDRGRITGRRVDLLAAHANWPTTALRHELTHLVLADLFADQKLPRWLDEGMAILADSPEKQLQHRGDLDRALERGAEFRLLELIGLPDYPPAQRWGTFYGQSASLVQFLIQQGGEQRFVEFVRVALADGYDHGLQQVYSWRIPDLERQWRAQLRVPAVPPSARKATAARRGSLERLGVQPVSLRMP